MLCLKLFWSVFHFAEMRRKHFFGIFYGLIIWTDVVFNEKMHSDQNASDLLVWSEYTNLQIFSLRLVYILYSINMLISAEIDFFQLLQIKILIWTQYFIGFRVWTVCAKTKKTFKIKNEVQSYSNILIISNVFALQNKKNTKWRSLVCPTACIQIYFVMILWMKNVFDIREKNQF